MKWVVLVLLSLVLLAVVPTRVDPQTPSPTGTFQQTTSQQSAPVPEREIKLDRSLYIIVLIWTVLALYAAIFGSRTARAIIENTVTHAINKVVESVFSRELAEKASQAIGSALARAWTDSLTSRISEGISKGLSEGVTSSLAQPVESIRRNLAEFLAKVSERREFALVREIVPTATFSDNPEVMTEVQAIQQLRARRDYDAALLRAEDLRKQHPDEIDAWIVTIDTLVDWGKHTEAEFFLEKASALTKGDANKAFEIAYRKVRLDAVAGRLDAADAGLKHLKDRPDPRIGLAAGYVSWRRYESTKDIQHLRAATVETEKVLGSKPKDLAQLASVKNNLGYYYALLSEHIDDPNEAKLLLDRAIQHSSYSVQLYPSNDRYLDTQGLVKFQTAKMTQSMVEAEEALRYFRDCERLNPNHPFVKQHIFAVLGWLEQQKSVSAESPSVG